MEQAVKYNHESLYNNQLHIYTEASPNPQSMKFVLSSMLMPEGESLDCPDMESAKQAPLAQTLFGFPYVERVFFMSNFITITKAPSVEWTEAIPELRSFLQDYFAQKKPTFSETIQEEVAASNGSTHDSEMITKIKGVLDEYIKPAVEMDGGAIQFHSFNEDEGTLKVLLQGSCSGCPSSMVTLKAGIQNLMQRMVPQVKEVVAEGV